MKHLKKLRESRHLSQAKLADQLGVSQQSIHKYETSQTEPDFDTLKSMADFFHTTIDYLIGYESDYKDLLTQRNDEIYSPAELHHLFLYRNASSEVQKSIDILLENINTYQK